jgi:PIN domain nuclease of toxin-antitoxin system
MSKIFVLDACALIALLNGENGADKVLDAYKKADIDEAKIIMNRINLLEVYYGFYHDKGEEYAKKVINSVEQSIITISEFDKNIFPIAGRLKASYKISLADSIALAQTILDGELLTADHHEFDAIVGKEPIIFHWIR